MLIVRSPLRITLGGGSTDLRSYYSQYEGFCISATIDKYVYVSVHHTFEHQILLKYSQLENVQTIDEIKHPIFRECLRLLDFKTPQIEIASMADIPAGTGLGSSGAFTSALLKALHSHRHISLPQSKLAELACEVEIDILKEPVGKQDQYATVYGGINCFTFKKDGEVVISPLNIKYEDMKQLESNLLLFFTGFSRSASKILEDQKAKTLNEDFDVIGNLHKTKMSGYYSKNALETGKLNEFGELLHEHWMRKKNRYKGMSNNIIDGWYQTGLDNGALGGKLVGAGGAGFLMFYTNDADKLRYGMKKITGLEEVKFNFDFEGTKVVL